MFIKKYKIISFSHKTTKIDGLKDYIISDEQEGVFPSKKLKSLKTNLQMDELLYLNTCNRVLFFFTTDHQINESFLSAFFRFINPKFSTNLLNTHISKSLVFEGQAAISHFFGVAASLDSLVIGEREILGQIKNAYEKSKKSGLTHDAIRIAVEQAIVFAKKTYSETKIGEKPVSVVSLAHKTLLNYTDNINASIVIVGAGQTNALMAGMVAESGFKNISIYNRTISKAQNITNKIGSSTFGSLDDFFNKNENFDILISCLDISKPIFTNEWARKNLNISKKYIFIDLAVPSNFDKRWLSCYNIDYIDVPSLQVMAENNMAFRKNELIKAQMLLFNFLESFTLILKERALELALTEVPQKVKAVRKRAVENIFKKEIETLDTPSKLVLEKMMDYFEKKYIAIPIKLVKKSILNIETQKF